MTGDEFKAYWILLFQSWLQEPRATLPYNDEQLAILARMSPHAWDSVRATVFRMFTQGEDGRIYNDRLMAESDKQNNRSRAGAKNIAKRYSTNGVTKQVTKKATKQPTKTTTNA